MGEKMVSQSSGTYLLKPKSSRWLREVNEMEDAKNISYMLTTGQT